MRKILKFKDLIKPIIEIYQNGDNLGYGISFLFKQLDRKYIIKKKK